MFVAQRCHDEARLRILSGLIVISGSNKAFQNTIPVACPLIQGKGTAGGGEKVGDCAIGQATQSEDGFLDKNRAWLL